MFHRDQILRVQSVSDQRGSRKKDHATAYTWGDPDTKRPGRSERHLARALRDYLATREAIESSAAELDPHAEARLRALGYIEPSVVERGDREE